MNKSLRKMPVGLVDVLYRSARPLLFQRDAETAHEVAIGLLASLSRHDLSVAAMGMFLPRPDERFAVSAFGLRFPSPLGIAAGLDKNAVAFPALLALGFGHVEVGTVTPRPQEGNPRPRVFRLIEDQALINRMGFPGVGIAEAVRSLAMLKRPRMIAGCNIGPNRTSVEAGISVNDLVAAYRAVASSASFVTINVSSPNTAGLRALQQASVLREILDAVNDERRTLMRKPLLLKISPDLSDGDLVTLLDVALAANVDGVVATNTTIERPAGLRSQWAREAGGLSGAPLAPLASRIIRRIHTETSGNLTVVAAGGIRTGADVVAALSLGATLAQTYTGFIYRGPAMPHLVELEISAELKKRGFESLDELRASVR